MSMDAIRKNVPSVLLNLQKFDNFRFLLVTAESENVC